MRERYKSLAQNALKMVDSYLELHSKSYSMFEVVIEKPTIQLKAIEWAIVSLYHIYRLMILDVECDLFLLAAIIEKYLWFISQVRQTDKQV